MCRCPRGMARWPCSSGCRPAVSQSHLRRWSHSAGARTRPGSPQGLKTQRAWVACHTSLECQPRPSPESLAAQVAAWREAESFSPRSMHPPRVPQQGAWTPPQRVAGTRQHLLTSRTRLWLKLAEPPHLCLSFTTCHLCFIVYYFYFVISYSSPYQAEED